MADNDKSAEDQLQDALWTWVQRFVLAAVLFGAGLFSGYFRWGDAVEMRQNNRELQDVIVDLKNQRETLSTRISREQRDKEVCQRDLRALKNR